MTEIFFWPQAPRLIKPALDEEILKVIVAKFVEENKATAEISEVNKNLKTIP